MTRFFHFLAAVLILSGVARAQEPTASPILRPLLQIYEVRIKGSDLNQLSYDVAHPLLTIREVWDLRLARDGKGVLIILNENEAKALADLTREYNGRPLMFKAIDGAVQPITIKGPVEDGRIGFKYPEAEPLAADYRRHFHLGEFEDKAP